MELTLIQVAKLTGIDALILKRMRSRESVSLLSGPPFCKVIDKDGQSKYIYKKHEVQKWLKRRMFRITAGDAAALLGISRLELLATYGSSQHSWESPRGKLVMSAGKNIFLWYPRASLQVKKTA